MSKDEKQFKNPVGPWSYEGKISIEFFPGNTPIRWGVQPFPTRKPVAVFEKATLSQDENWVHVWTPEPAMYPSFTVNLKKILGNGKLLWVNPHLKAFFAGYMANVEIQNPYDEASHYLDRLMWNRGRESKKGELY